MNKPEIKGWEITHNEKGVEMGSLPAEQLRNLFVYVDLLEQNCIKHGVMQAEVSDGANGAAVGQRSAGKSVRGGCKHEMNRTHKSQLVGTCIKCGEIFGA